MFHDIILDIDHTLVHAVDPSTLIPRQNSKLQSIQVDSELVIFLRPFLQEFLDFLFENFRVSIWTAAGITYAKQIVNKVILTKPNRTLYAFLTDDTTTLCEKMTGHHKLLKFTNKIFKSPLIIDDRIDVYKSQPKKAYNIKEFNVRDADAINDQELLILKNILILSLTR